MDADFWEFWRPGYGYDKAAWFERYLEERAAKPLKPGKTRRQKISATRRNIECFVEGTVPAQVLETNIYAKASDDMKSLDLASREIAPFKFLLEKIKPKAIVVHGKPAVEAIRKFAVSAFVIEADHHFSRQTSKDAARNYGAAAAKEVGADTPLQANLAAIAPFATLFATKGFSFGRWVSDDTPGGLASFPSVTLSPEADTFVQAAYDGGLVLEDFPWAAWKDSQEARRLWDMPGAVEKASARQLAQLLTVLIRGDRFSEGSLLGAFDSGLLNRIVQRAVAIGA